MPLTSEWRTLLKKEEAQSKTFHLALPSLRFASLCSASLCFALLHYNSLRIAMRIPFYKSLI
jgi:hypothetical protein